MSAYLIRILCIIFIVTSLSACDQTPMNYPYDNQQREQNILYTAFSEQPKHLDPAKSYSSDEYAFIGQIYEPPLQYHYLKRPYTLIPLTATEMPRVQFYDINDKLLIPEANPKDIAYSVYDIYIKPNIDYQPHPALAKNVQDNYLYHQLTLADIEELDDLADFAVHGTRELVAADYVYQIKRLAHPRLNSPILALMQDYIVGLDDYTNTLSQHYQQSDSAYLDLRDYPLSGAKVIDDYHYQITIKGKDPQFLYWLAMPFYAPMPWEADRFYSQAGLKDKNISLDWYPIGTGPYQLQVNNPNKKMVMVKNPNYHGETYPSEGDADDIANGLLVDAGQPLPFIDKVIYTLEKESIPRWSKFLQGYYDYSGISSDNFDQAVSVTDGGDLDLSAQLSAMGIDLQTNVGAGTYYWGFNMLDEVVGGSSERARKLRQAISLAVNIEEYIAIFLNGRGITAQSPLPPGIFGYQTGRLGMNGVIYQWRDNKIQRQSIETARALLSEAGYPQGRDAKTGDPLIIYYDVVASGGPDDKARLAWMVKQFAKLGIQLQVRATQYNRFREKMRNGNAQLFSWGWHADYPDPENFLFLLYGPNGKVAHGGENAANYQNARFDALYAEMKDMENTPERAAIIDEMTMIIQQDAPWIWGFHPQNFVLTHQWNGPVKPNEMANNTLKYKRLDPSIRHRFQHEWNNATFWPLGLVGIGFIIGGLPVALSYWRKEREPNLHPRLPKDPDS